MKLTLNRLAFIEALTPLVAVIPGKTNFPVLEYVQVRTSNRLAQLVTTDLERFAKANLTADTAETGDCCVPAKLILTLLKKCNTEEVTLEFDAGADVRMSTVQLISGEARMTLPALAAEEFPPCYTLAEVHRYELDALALRQALKSVIPCMSNDESRFVLCGVAFEFKHDTITLAAVDGRRLSTITLPCPDSPEVLVIVPAATVGTMLSMLATVKEEQSGCAFVLNGPIEHPTHVELLLPGGQGVVSKIIEGNYPNYRAVIPQRDDLKFHVSLPLAELRPALERAVALSGKNVTGVKLSLLGTALRLELAASKCTSRLLDTIAVTGTADAPDWSPRMKDPLPLACYNTDYLLDACNMAQGDTLRIECANSLSAGLVTDTVTQWTHVVMPMRFADPAAVDPASETDAAQVAKAEARTEEGTDEAAA